jgi:choline-sulfatase
MMTARKMILKDRPNILFLMADQIAAPALALYGNKVCKTPHIDALAETSVVFEKAYCNSPLCAPTRFSLMTGRLPAAIDAFDNASEFHAELPTIAHHLAALDYRTILCGKMHFIGPDQLHGFDERLTTDVYPASFCWIPNWEAGPTFISSGVTLRSVVEAGPCIRSMQMDYDDEVEYYALRKVYDLARDGNDRPFFLTVSFTQPHSPYTPGQEFWDLYRPEQIDRPTVPEIPYDDLDAMSQGLFFAHGRNLHTITDDHLRNARHGYYGMISCIDDKIGRILSALDDTGLLNNTIVVFTSDHGEMLGERGMWYKHCFFEWASRVPLVVSFPNRFQPRRVPQLVSHTDLLPTFVELASTEPGSTEPLETDGQSLVSLLQGDEAFWDNTVIADYNAIGPCVPCRMIRQGRYKYHYIHGHDPLLFDMEDDPNELRNLANENMLADVRTSLETRLCQNYDPDEVDARVRASQRRRFFIAKANKGKAMWDYVAHPGDEAKYVRNARVDDTKGRNRFPPVEAVAQDRQGTTQ